MIVYDCKSKTRLSSARPPYQAILYATWVGRRVTRTTIDVP